MGVECCSLELQKEWNGLVVKIKHKSNLFELSTVSNDELLAAHDILGPKALHGFYDIHILFHLAKDHMLAINYTVLAVQVKNWESFVLGLIFAMGKMPGPVCFGMKFSHQISPHRWTCH